MDIWYYIMTPFTLLLKLFYDLFSSYGVALILFTVVIRVILFPFSLKGKKGMIQMNMLSGKMQKLQKMYGNNQAKYNEEVQKLYAKEKVSPMSGCLWSLLPMFILIPLYAIIRQPMKYMMGMTPDQITAVANGVLDWANVAVGRGWIKEAAEFANVGYNQLYLSSLITPQNLAAVQAAAGETGRAIFSINFNFLGLDLSQIPQLKFWANGMSWNSFGLFLIPIISAGVTVVMSLVMNKTNNINGAAQQNKSNWMMLALSPIMYLFFGFNMPGALSIYLLASSVLGIFQELISGKLLKKDYEAAAEEMKRRELEEKEEEKRQRRKKAEQRALEAEEAKKNKGKKKPKTEGEEEGRSSTEVREASRVGIRQYARGRAYDPDRFGGVTPYYEDAEALEKFRAKVAAGEIVPKAGAEAAPAPETPAPEAAEAPVTETSELQQPAAGEPAASQEPAAESVPAEEAHAEEAPAEDIVETLQAEIDAAVAEDEPSKED